MSVSSHFYLNCTTEAQVKAVEQFPETEYGKARSYFANNYDSAEDIIYEMKKKDLNLEFYGCFSLDSFSEFVEDICPYLAKTLPTDSFEANGEVCCEIDGFTERYTIKYSDGILHYTVGKGETCYDEDDNPIDDYYYDNWDVEILE